VFSQFVTHQPYGGVVPELASREHLRAIVPVVRQALADAKQTYQSVDALAVTQGPGLAGSLLVGISYAKGLAFALDKPLIAVNHLEGHIHAVLLEERQKGNRELDFPVLALVVSGGHTHLYLATQMGPTWSYENIGHTRDDAAGEAFDKVAKLLGLPYPGGVVIDRLAAQGDPAGIKFPRPLLHDGSFNFSFSGLKTAVLNYLQKNPAAGEGSSLNDLCASFQAAVCEVLVSKTAAAVMATGIKRVVVAGGVACNSALRSEMGRVACEEDLELHIPSPLLCTDNAAMIAVPGDYYLANGMASGPGLDSLPVWPLDTMAARLKRS
jgi:N6-L-threonylcarbamoyladenine synthase